MTTCRAIFLDVGGTLLEMGDPAGAYLAVLQEHGYPATLDQVHQWLADARTETRPLRTVPAADYTISAEREQARRMAMVNAFLRHAGVRREADLQACREAIYDTWIGSPVFRLFPETISVLERLKQLGFLLGTVSNWEPRLDRLCTGLGIARYLDFILASEAEGYAKPGTRLFELALERTGLDPSQVIHVGDSPVEDIQAAESLGIRGVLIQRAGERRPDHSPHIPSLEALVPLAQASAWLRGQVAAGKGEAAGFTQLEWVRRQVNQHFRFEPYAGTLNLRLDGPQDQATWVRLRQAHGVVLEPAPGFCAARCYPVTVDGQFPGAIVLPEVSGYPTDVVEVISPAALRASLGLREGYSVTLAVRAG